MTKRAPSRRKTPLRLNIVVDDIERERFLAAAQIERQNRRGKTLSDWVRRTLNQAADAILDGSQRAAG